MFNISRRGFLQGVGAAGALSLAGCGPEARVVVVGGGFGGATAARYVKWHDPSISVTLIEPSKTHVTCPFSNLVLSGLRSIDSITQNFKGMETIGVKVIHEMATAVDPAKKTVTTQSGMVVPYDKLILSPGIDFKFDEKMGYTEKTSETIPHAWKAGPQTALLRKQLEAMPDGGVVLMSSPANPFRCPPGPYERASMIAAYLKEAKPKSKLIILDSKDAFSKQGLFLEGWKLHYANIIEWVPSNKDGKVIRVDAANMMLHTEFAKHKGAVINYIPQQKAGAIAFQAGVTNELGWCPINPVTFESTLQKDIHVVGDAAIVGEMPKSGTAASTQAKVCAAAVVALLKGQKPGVPTTSNTCYSMVTKDYAISITATYKATDKGFVAVAGAGGVSPTGEGPAFRANEAKYARGWYANITKDIWG